MSALQKQTMALIRDKARRGHLTQKTIASELGVSLPTVKRWWAGKGVTLEVLGQLCAVLGFSLSQLFSELEGGAPSYVYSLEQEQMLVNQPKALAVFDLLIGGETPASITRRYSLKENELFTLLVKLERARLIEVGERNRIKLLQSGEPQWIVDGPLSRKYRRQMIDSLLGAHAKTESSFYIHDYLPEDAVLLKGKMRELENLMQSCNARGKLRPEDKVSYGAYLCLKPFEWDLRASLAAK